MAPLSNGYIRPDSALSMEPTFPLCVYVCDKCLLVQLPEFEAPANIFSETYAYFSSYSDSWLEHCRRYVDMVTARFGLTSRHQVIELASNDGYLLQYFAQRSIPVLGIEPAASVASAAIARGIPTRVEFFGSRLATTLVTEGTRANLLIGNNVLAHVPDLNDFVKGAKIVLAPGGVITLEFPHLLNLIEQNQFDTVYHEHFSYFSLLAVEPVFHRHGLRLFDVDCLPTHGGSLRIYACHDNDTARQTTPRVAELNSRETAAGLRTPACYAAFGERVRETKRKLLTFLIGARRSGKRVAAYGAAAKGNTLLNYCGIRTDFIDFVADRNPHKQGCLMPGSRIPIVTPEQLREARPDYVLILPWNIREEVMTQLADVRSWGGQFVVPIPEVKVFP
jgi:SAM-dependent methyltransferase